MKARVRAEGTLLDAVLRMLDTATRTTARKFIKKGRVMLDGAVCSLPNHPVLTGQGLEFIPPGRETPKVVAPRPGAGRPFRILHEDERIIVVDKPAGLLSIGTGTERSKTLFRMVSDHVKEHTDGRGRVFIVHRLDRDVSGVVVLAKDEPAKRLIQESWDRAVKEYVAVVDGRPAETEGTVRSWLRENRAHRVFICEPSAEGAQEAVTHYLVVGEGGGHSRIEVRLETGRKHQIRVHLASLGCPIVGDRVYGHGRAGSGIALHARSLTFEHPETGLPINCKSPLPRRFKGLLRADEAPASPAAAGERNSRAPRRGP